MKISRPASFEKWSSSKYSNFIFYKALFTCWKMFSFFNRDGGYSL